MNARGFAVVLVGLCSGLVASGQTGPTQQEIEAKLRGPFVLLRGMYDGQQLNFDAQGNLAAAAGTLPFALSFVVVKSVVLSDSELRVEGSRAGLQIEQRRPLAQPDKVKAVAIDKNGQRFLVNLTIAWDPAHPEELAAALERIFHVGFDEGLAQLAPQYWKPWIEHQLHPDRPFPETPVGVETLGSLLAKNKLAKMPRLVQTVDPSTTEAARFLRLTGISTIALAVDATGAPRDMVIVKPLGMGLDEMAVATAAQYRFAPATNHGQPVPVEINIEMNFR
jgi:Gram-negative bacterial TonB protein C-terminal